jgi:hypothetical protein
MGQKPHTEERDEVMQISCCFASQTPAVLLEDMVKGGASPWRPYSRLAERDRSPPCRYATAVCEKPNDRF